MFVCPQVQLQPCVCVPSGSAAALYLCALRFSYSLVLVCPQVQLQAQVESMKKALLAERQALGQQYDEEMEKLQVGEGRG